MYLQAARQLGDFNNTSDGQPILVQTHARKRLEDPRYTDPLPLIVPGDRSLNRLSLGIGSYVSSTALNNFPEHGNSSDPLRAIRIGITGQLGSRGFNLGDVPMLVREEGIDDRFESGPDALVRAVTNTAVSEGYDEREIMAFIFMIADRTHGRASGVLAVEGDMWDPGIGQHSKVYARLPSLTSESTPDDVDSLERQLLAVKKNLLWCVRTELLKFPPNTSQPSQFSDSFTSLNRTRMYFQNDLRRGEPSSKAAERLRKGD